MNCRLGRVTLTLALSTSAFATDVTFAVIGDMPYCASAGGVSVVCSPPSPEYKAVLNIFAAIRSSRVPFAVHVGDVFNAAADACSDAAFRSTRELFDQVALPMLVIPGDNETTDCPSPLVALSHFRTHLIPTPPTALGETRSLQRPENVIWQHRGIVFVAVNAPGSPSVEGELEDDAIRTVSRAFDQAEHIDAPIVIFAQAKISRSWFARLNAVLIERTKQLERPVLFIHGDLHEFEVERAYQGVRALTRHQVLGAPASGWSLITFVASSDTFEIVQR